MQLLELLIPVDRPAEMAIWACLVTGVAVCPLRQPGLLSGILIVGTYEYACVINPTLNTSDLSLPTHCIYH